MGFASAAHPSIFALILAGCLGDIITSAILVGGYNSGEEPPRRSLATRTRYLLFCGLWTFGFSLIYMLGFRVLPQHLCFSAASHLVFLSTTIVLFVSGSAALTSLIRNQDFPHQTRLEILQGFAWADSVLLFVALLLILAIAIGRRNGLSASLAG